VLAVGRFAGARQRFANPTRDEVEGGAAVHRKMRPRVVRQDKDGHVIRWRLTPPATPRFIGPRAAYGTEHVSAENPGSNVVRGARGERFVQTVAATFLAMHFAERQGLEEPLVQLHAVLTERMVLALVWSGAIAVDGD